MANEKLTAQTEVTQPQHDDIYYLVIDPGGSPGSRKIERSNLIDWTYYSTVIPTRTTSDSMAALLLVTFLTSCSIFLQLSTLIQTNPTSQYTLRVAQ